jgi:hypothetical protein
MNASSVIIMTDGTTIAVRGNPGEIAIYEQSQIPGPCKCGVICSSVWGLQPSFSEQLSRPGSQTPALGPANT